MLERKPAVARDVIGVGMRLDRADDPHPARLGLGEQRVDLERRVDDDRHPRFLVSHQIGRTPQIVVQELMEDHVGDRSTRSRYPS